MQCRTEYCVIGTDREWNVIFNINISERKCGNQNLMTWKSKSDDICQCKWEEGNVIENLTNDQNGSLLFPCWMKFLTFSENFSI